MPAAEKVSGNNAERASLRAGLRLHEIFQPPSRRTRGRPPAGARSLLIRHVIAARYRTFSEWLIKHRNDPRLDRLARLYGFDQADWWNGPRHERAARMVQRALQRGRRTVTTAHIRNTAAKF